MAVATTYSWQLVKNIGLSVGATIGGADITSLANGGFAAIGEHIDHHDGHIFSSSAAITDFFDVASSLTGAIDQLSNGNLVIASRENASTSRTQFKIVNSVTGDDVVATTVIDDSFQSNQDVAALTGGGFWIVADDDIDGITGASTTLDVHIRNNDGSFVGFFIVDGGPLVTAVNPSVAGLDNGTVAVAWQREVAGESEIWYAVYSAVGLVIKAPALLDAASTVNRNVSITATNAGFAVVYESGGWFTGANDITLWKFDSAGNSLGFANVSNPARVNDFSHDANPYITRLANGMLAVAYSNNANTNSDTIVRLVDPASGAVLATRNITGGGSITDDVEKPAIAGFAQGRLAVLHTNLAGSTINGEDLQGVRTSTGDAANDTMVGDDFLDIMQGGAGADFLFGAAFLPSGAFRAGSGNDSLFGGVGDDGAWGADGNDMLDGGLGNDGLVGGAGNDALHGGDGNDFLFGGDFSVVDGSRLPGSGADALNGGSGNDALYGFDGNDIINGEAGNDYVEAGEGGDVVNGGADSDTLLGQDGADTINGGTGFDYLYGGAGADIFSFRRLDSYDTAWDFSAAQGDKLRLDPALGITNFAQFQAKLTGFTFEGVAYSRINFASLGSNDEITIGGVAHTAWTAAMVEFV